MATITVLRIQRRVAAWAVFAAACLLAAPAAAEWRAGFQQGNDWASVGNGRDAMLRVYCSSRAERPQASIWFEPGGSGVADPGSYQEEIVFVVDGNAFATHGYWQDGNVVYHLYSDQRLQEGNALVEEMRRGSRLELQLPRHEVSESFTLAGSARALEGIFDGCRQIR